MAYNQGGYGDGGHAGYGGGPGTGGWTDADYGPGQPGYGGPVGSGADDPSPSGNAGEASGFRETLDRISDHFNPGGLPGTEPSSDAMADFMDGLMGLFGVPHREAVDANSPGLRATPYGGQMTTQKGYSDSVQSNFSERGYMGTSPASDPNSPYHADYQAAHEQAAKEGRAAREEAITNMHEQVAKVVDEQNLTPTEADKLRDAVVSGDLKTLSDYGLNVSEMRDVHGASEDEMDVTTNPEMGMWGLKHGFFKNTPQGISATWKTALAPASYALSRMAAPFGLDQIGSLTMGELAKGLGIMGSMKGASKAVSGPGMNKAQKTAAGVGSVLTGADLYGVGNLMADMSNIGNAGFALGRDVFSERSEDERGGGLPWYNSYSA